MTDLHLYTSTFYEETGTSNSFNLYLSSSAYTSQKREVKYFNPSTPQTGDATYNFNFYPLDSSTATISAEFTDGTTSTLLKLSSIGEGTYNNKTYIFLTDDTPGIPTPQPSAYLNADTGEVLFPLTDLDTYAQEYSAGATSIIFNSGYYVPRFFSNDFYAGSIQIDFGDNNTGYYDYSGNQNDTITHTYTAAGTFDISLTAQQLTAVDPNTYSLNVGSFLSAVNITNSKYQVEDNVVRINSDTDVELPHPTPFIPVKEWISHEAVNAVFEKLYNNYEYIVNTSNIYQLSPLFYNGWGGVRSIADNRNILEWHTTTHFNTSIYVDTDFQDISDISAVINETSYNLYIGSTDKVERFDYKLSDNETIADTESSDIYETIARVKSIDTDRSNRIYVLDERKLLVRVYSYNSVEQEYIPFFEWGGLGGQTGVSKFYKPNDMFIANDKVFVIDSGNNCIKRFTLGGQWEYTYTSPEFTTGDIGVDAPISGALDNDKNLYVVNKTRIVKFNYDGEELYARDIQKLNATPLKMMHNRGFIYVLTEDDIIRIVPSGESTNTFASRADLSANISTYVSFYIDSKDNIYLTDGRIITRYVDSPILLDASPRTNSRYKDFADIKVTPDSLVDAAVYNSFFSRMYDNLKIFFHTIEKKVIKSSDGTLSLVSLESCDVGAFQGLIVDKDEIYIGMNEIVTPEVVNRCIKKLLITQQFIIDVLLNKYSGCNTGDPISFTIITADLGACKWTWQSRKTGLCCLTWERIKQAGTTWDDASNC